MIKKPEIKFQESNEVQLIKQNYHNKVFPNTNNDSYKTTFMSYLKGNPNIDFSVTIIYEFPVLQNTILDISENCEYLT